MKNMEKYPDTKDALEAYSEYVSNVVDDIDFQRWLQRDYVAPREPTLLEAAENVIDEYCVSADDDGKNLGCAISILEKIVKREKQKPVRNCDRYATAKEAQEAFFRICKSHDDCDGCQIEKIRDEASYQANCMMCWVYAAADEAGKGGEK